MRTMQQEQIDKKLSDDRIQAKELSKVNASKQPKETLSRREWEEIMVVNRDTYQNQGGVYRRKR